MSNGCNRHWQTQNTLQMKDYLTHSSSSNLNIEKWAFERVDAAAEAIKNYLSFKSAIDGRKLVKTQQTNSALSHLSLPIPSTETAALYKTRSAKENKGLWLLLCNLGIFVMIGLHLYCLLKGKLNLCSGSRWIHQYFLILTCYKRTSKGLSMDAN